MDRTSPSIFTLNNFLNSLDKFNTTSSKSSSTYKPSHYENIHRHTYTNILNIDKKEPTDNNANPLFISKLKEDNSTLKSENKQLKKQIILLNHELQNTKTLNDDLTYNFNYIQSKYQNDLSAVDSIITNQNNKINELTSMINKQNEQIDLMNSDIKFYEKQASQMKEQITNYKHEEIQKVIDKVNEEKYLQLIEEKDAIINTLSQQLQTLTGKYELNENKCKMYESDKIKQEELLNSKDKFIEKLQNENRTLQQTNNDNEVQIKNNENKINELISTQNNIQTKYETQLNALENQLKEAPTQNEISSYKEHISTLESQIKELKEMNSYLLSQMSKLPELEEHFEIVFDDMLKLKNENEILRKQMELSQQQQYKSQYQNPQENIDINHNFSLLPKTISPYLALYAVKPDKLVSYNFNKNQIRSFKPENYDKFIEDYIEDGSITHNSLTGLFVITSKNFNVLYYFSFRNNTFNRLFTFNTNHKNGCVLLDGTSKNMFAVGGINSNKVEKLSLESAEIVSFPDLNEPRSHFTCCLIDDDLLYIFLGYSQSKNKCIDSIETINLQKPENGWSVFQCNDSLYEIRSMSVLPYGKDQMIIVGGEKEDGSFNKHLIKFNGVENKIEIVNKDGFYNKNKEKGYLFSKSSMFAIYVDESKNDILFCNIDDDLNPHLFDSDLNYETIFF